ncbi:aldo/keto reductase [Pseudomassariella vexata]|uniref:Aldo/keto reductase n=1 Tax=Pseudomassariella vexata TaxID=1141098 RepID=A0A1Y2DDZ8_9PEZI|nr:aldo/keto reductase [Pseudomassariella vexata]ORY57427.1 aldo/keto reductase [Pseudomassariella vexata]
MKMTPPGLTLTSRITLQHSDSRMPVLGFGVYQIDRADCTAACLSAISAGYRHIDTAQLYQNESEVGVALQRCGLPREEIFVTTKIRYPRLGKGKTYLRALQSIQKIDPRQDGYVDLFLIHSPHTLNPKDRKEIWLALEKLHKDGKIKAIGMKEYATIWPPAVNQILLHPWTQQRETVDYCNELGIVLQAFSPLARGNKLGEPTVVEIAEKLGKTPAQVLIRYCLQKGWIPLQLDNMGPVGHSEKEERIKQNADVFDFRISEDDMATLDRFDRQQGPRFE